MGEPTVWLGKYEFLYFMDNIVQKTSRRYPLIKVLYNAWKVPIFQQSSERFFGKSIIRM